MRITTSLKSLAPMAFAACLAGGSALYFYYLHSPASSPPRLRGTIVRQKLEVDGRTREMLVYAPPNLSPGAPLILALHGSMSNPARMRSAMGYELELLADQHGFAVVYPAGIGGAWNDCRKVAPFEAKRLDIDDVAFLTRVIDTGHAVDGIARDKVFAIGYSNGAQMVFRMMLEASDTLAGAATFGGNLPEDANMRCAKKGPTPPIMLVSGTADPIVPFGGGDASLFGFASRGNVISANETLSTFAALNGLDCADAIVSSLPHLHDEDPTSVRLIALEKEGRPYVMQYIVEGGGHVVPQQKVGMPRIFGRITGDLNGPAAAIDFFRSVAANSWR